jgi:hypothetical protein
MTLHKLLTCAVTALLFLAFTTSAQAAPACFHWICYTGTGECDFDASCSGEGSEDTPLNFRWTWGDGSPLESIWYDPLASHTYAYPIATSYVTLSAGYLFIGYYDVTCEIHIRNQIGPPEPDFSGTCP